MKNSIILSNLFIKIQNAEFKTVGDAVDYAIQVDDENELVYLIFEASNGKRDWQVNLNFIFNTFKRKIYKEQTSCIRCHRGFGNSYKSANDDIMSDFFCEWGKHPGYTPVICGWSYGGAMSVLAAEDFNYRSRTDKFDTNTGIKPVVITFGAPKIFNRKSAKYVYDCCDIVVQVAQHNDIVTHLVPFASHVNLSNKLRVGKKFSIVEIFKPTIYHQEYANKNLYSPETEVVKALTV